MPWSISDFSATGNTSVLTAASTRNTMASAMRLRYGRKKGARPLSERTFLAGAGGAGVRGAAVAGKGAADAVGMEDIRRVY